MKANEIVERFKNVLLSNEVEVEVSEVKEEAAPEEESLYGAGTGTWEDIFPDSPGTSIL